MGSRPNITDALFDTTFFRRLVCAFLACFLFAYTSIIPLAHAHSVDLTSTKTQGIESILASLCLSGKISSGDQDYSSPKKHHLMLSCCMVCERVSLKVPPIDVSILEYSFTRAFTQSRIIYFIEDGAIPPLMLSSALQSRAPPSHS
jgi:hypothetical protein